MFDLKIWISAFTVEDSLQYASGASKACDYSNECLRNVDYGGYGV